MMVTGFGGVSSLGVAVRPGVGEGGQVRVCPGPSDAYDYYLAAAVVDEPSGVGDQSGADSSIRISVGSLSSIAISCCTTLAISTNRGLLVTINSGVTAGVLSAFANYIEKTAPESFSQSWRIGRFLANFNGNGHLSSVPLLPSASTGRCANRRGLACRAVGQVVEVFVVGHRSSRRQPPKRMPRIVDKVSGDATARGQQRTTTVRLRIEPLFTGYVRLPE